MAKVGIVMGSDSDMPVMGKAAAVLEEFGIEYEQADFEDIRTVADILRSLEEW